MTKITSLIARAVLAAAVVVCSLALTPSALRAQAETHEISELETIPKFSSPPSAVRTIHGSYPAALKRAGVNGTVQLEFVVLPTGKVEPGSVQIVAASSPAFGEAAKGMAEKIEFTPGTIKGEAVRARVILPLVYRAQ